MQRDYDFFEESAREATAPARIVTTPCGLRFALAVHSTLEVIEQPKALKVPGAAQHAIGLLEWQGRRIPFVDADVVLGSGSRTASTRFALVLAWQRDAGAPIEHGAIAIDALPESVQVSDSAQCAAPDGIAAVAVSAFLLGDEAVPVLDSSVLFRVKAPRAPASAAESP